MSKLDEIEERVNLFGPDDMLCSDVLFVLKVARKAEEMAKFYGDSFNWHVQIGLDNSGDKAREFLAFLKEGEE